MKNYKLRPFYLSVGETLFFSTAQVLSRSFQGFQGHASSAATSAESHFCKNFEGLKAIGVKLTVKLNSLKKKR